jgi:hypothetical protein
VESLKLEERSAVAKGAMSQVRIINVQDGNPCTNKVLLGYPNCGSKADGATFTVVHLSTELTMARMALLTA